MAGRQAQLVDDSLLEIGSWRRKEQSAGDEVATRLLVTRLAGVDDVLQCRDELSRPGEWCRIDHHDCSDGLRVLCRELKDRHATHRVADRNRAIQPELPDQPRNIVGILADRIPILGLVALAVPAEVHGHDSVLSLEVIVLGLEERPIAGPTVEENEGWFATPLVLVGELDPVALLDGHGCPPCLTNAK